jgi:predicted ATPase/DNA-binding SARP family transcriptional activator
MNSHLLQLKLFGSPQISYQGQPLNGFVSAKVRALLLYLAATDRPQSRDHLAHLLWEDTPASMKVNLRKALSNLRQLIGNVLVEDAKESITLDTQRVWVDVVEFGRLIQQGAAQQAAALYQADFLTGFNLSLSYEFEAWALREQSRLKSQMVDLLRRLATQQEANSKRSEAISTVRRLLDLEPWHEENHRWLMDLLAKDGQRSAALAHFAICQRILREELDAPPSAETLALVEQIQQQTLPGQACVTQSNHQATYHQPVAPRSNLPTQATTLLGRAADQARVIELLGNAPGRLVTLVGPPGIGKTRLGLAVAQQLETSCADGVYFVPLAAITDAELVTASIATALRLKSDGDQSPQAVIGEFLQDKAALLLLDNFEQILPAAPLIAELLTGCPKLLVLVTSRERLHLYAEQLYRVPALAIEPAIQLFTERVRALDIDLPLPPESTGVVGEICQQLDCLPLALELSAPQLELMTLGDLLTQVRNQRLTLLNDGPRDLPDRQRTLRNAITTSYRLLHAGEQALFRALGLCVGGFDHAAVTGLGFDLATLQALIHKSLVQVSTADDKTRRYLLLETLREYALAQLAAEGESATLGRRHALHYLTLAEEAATHFRGSEQGAWLGRLAQDHDNLRAALQWAFTNHATDICGRLGLALRGFWYTRGYYAEGWQWLERLLTQIDQPTWRAKLLYTRGRYARRMGKSGVAIESYSQSLSLFRQLNDIEGIASSLRGLGMIYFLQDDNAQARPLFAEALTLFRQLHDAEGIAATLDGLGYVAENLATAIAYYQESLMLRRSAGNTLGIAVSLNHLAHIALDTGDYAAARTYQKEYLQLNRALGNQNGIANALYVSGLITFAEGDFAAAHPVFVECLELCQKTGDNTIPGLYRAMGAITLRQGDYHQAGIHFAHAFTHHRIVGANFEVAIDVGHFACLAARQGKAWPALCALGGIANIVGSLAELNWLERQEFALGAAHARCHLSEAEGASAWATGHTMTIEQLIDFGLTHLQPATN